MPTDVAWVVAGIVAAFVAFAVVMAWADFYSRHNRPSWPDTGEPQDH